MNDDWRENFRTFKLHDGWWYEPVTPAWVAECVGKFILGFAIAAPAVCAVYLLVVGLACLGWS